MNNKIDSQFKKIDYTISESDFNKMSRRDRHEWDLYDIETKKIIKFNNMIDGLKAVRADIYDDYDVTDDMSDFNEENIERINS